MQPEFIFSRSASKHGIAEIDIIWAFDNYVYDSIYERGAKASEDKHLLIGCDINANMLEIMYNMIDDGVFRVFHAMKRRNIYIKLLDMKGDGRND